MKAFDMIFIEVFVASLLVSSGSSQSSSTTYSTSVEVSPSPNSVNGTIQVSNATIQVNSSTQTSEETNATVAATGGTSALSQASVQVSSQAGQINASSTASVSLGGQTSMSGGGQSPGSGGQSPGSGGQSPGSGGQSPGSGGQYAEQQAANLQNLTPAQRIEVERFDKERVEATYKMEIKEAIEPMTTERADISYVSDFGNLLEKSKQFGQEFDAKFNAQLNYVMISNSTALQTKKVDCVLQRVNNFPEKVNLKSTGANANSISLPLECPLVIINAPSRKRRDVELSVELDWDVHSQEDPIEYKHMYRYMRTRREAAQQQSANSSCFSSAMSPCLNKRLNMTLRITNKNFSASLKNKDSPEHASLTSEIMNLLKKNLTDKDYTWTVNMHSFEFSAGSLGVTFFVDTTTAAFPGVINQLQLVLNSSTLGPFATDPSASNVMKVTVVDGQWTQWSSWSPSCDNKHQKYQRRTCSNPSPQNGGKNCIGEQKKTKKCACYASLGSPISSPLVTPPGNKYPFDVDCIWTLEAPFNHTVVLHFNQFHLEKDKKCFYDYVEVFDGNSTEAASLMPRTCGRAGFNKTIKSSDTLMTVRFRSDRDVSESGFKASWKSVVKPWKPPKQLEHVEQNVTVTNLISCPTYNDTSIPLGKATTCPSKSVDADCYFENPTYLVSCMIGVEVDRNLPLKDSARMNTTFKHIMHKDLFPNYYLQEKICVTWNKSLGGVLAGAWTKKGCSVSSTNISHTSCECDHTGIFAVLATEKVVRKQFTLLANTYTGIGVSCFLILVAIVHIVWKVDIHGGEVMRMNICASILIMMVTFLVGANVEAERSLCGFLTFLVYFSVLAKFFWLMLHGLRIHGKIKEVFASGLNIEIVYVVFGWGLPLLLSLIAIGIQVDIKSPNAVCWTAVAGGGMWGYSAPVLIIVLCNLVVFIAILFPTKQRLNKYDYKDMKYRVMKDGVLLALFGLTCTTAYLTAFNQTFKPQYYLTVSVVLQAVSMIIFGREGRKDYVKKDSKKVDNDTFSQNTNEEEFLETIDDDASSETNSRNSGKKGNRGGTPDKRIKRLKIGKEEETDIDA